MSLIVWNLQQIERWGFILFQRTHVCFNESDYVTRHSAMNIMTKNGTKIMYKMPQLRFLVINIWYLSEKGYYKHTMGGVVVWLSCYVYIFAIWTYLTIVNQCLKIFFLKAIICHKENLLWMIWKKLQNN